MFVYTTCEPGTTERQAHQTPWDDVSVGTVIPDGWSLERIETGFGSWSEFVARSTRPALRWLRRCRTLAMRS